MRMGFVMRMTRFAVYYSGNGALSWCWQLAAYTCLFTFIQPTLKQRSSLTPFQQLLVTLMRFQLNLSRQDLACRFRIHSSTISWTFMHVKNVMYIKLKPLITWLEREILYETMPMDFRKYCPNCVVIIDCFEIFLERPTNLLARAQTYSSYKHHNTVKCLIGLTPQGPVSFISQGWGGRVSDKHLTENCGLLNKLFVCFFVSLCLPPLWWLTRAWK